MNVAALCAGYGGLELGLALTGIDVNLTWYAETDPHASKVMAFHQPNAINFGDVTKITNPPQVDIVTAGFPCQPVSSAGKRKGANDQRWLIDEICAISRRAGARRLFLENVTGLLTTNSGDAFSRVLSALADNGFDARWTCVRASDIGAPHQRLRWFCIADMDTARGENRAKHAIGQRGTIAANANSASRETRGESRPDRQRFWEEPLGFTSPASDAERQRTQIPAARQQPAVEMSGSVGTDRSARWGQYADAIHRWEPIVGRAAPDPTDNRRRLNPKFVEWMMGLPEGHVTDVVSSRSLALKILGNGVVPQQAAYALQLLDSYNNIK